MDEWSIKLAAVHQRVNRMLGASRKVQWGKRTAFADDFTVVVVS
jgi:hypothetical protein